MLRTQLGQGWNAVDTCVSGTPYTAGSARTLSSTGLLEQSTLDDVFTRSIERLDDLATEIESMRPISDLIGGYSITAGDYTCLENPQLDADPNDSRCGAEYVQCLQLGNGFAWSFRFEFADADAAREYLTVTSDGLPFTAFDLATASDAELAEGSKALRRAGAIPHLSYVGPEYEVVADLIRECSTDELAPCVNAVRYLQDAADAPTPSFDDYEAAIAEGSDSMTWALRDVVTASYDDL